MRRLTGLSVQTIVLGWLLIIPLGLLLPRHVLFEVINSIIIGGAVGTGTMFAPGFWDTLKFRPSDWKASDALILAIEGLCFGLAWVFITLWVRRAVNPYSMDAGLIDAVGRWILASSMILAFVACGSVNDNLPVGSYRRAGILVGLSVFGAFALLSLGIG